MIYHLKDTSLVHELFKDWEETLIYSCLQNMVGKIYVTDLIKPDSACACVGCFAFYAGQPCVELLVNDMINPIILVPQNQEWVDLIEKCLPNAKKSTRYAIKKDTKFNIEQLRKNVSLLPTGYELRQIDSELYDQCLHYPLAADFVSNFDTKSDFLQYGKGYVIMKDGQIVSGASSYSRYDKGIEIEVDTEESERRKGLALIASSYLILDCLKDGLYPSWDAQNKESVKLAEKLGYEYSHSYVVYIID